MTYILDLRKKIEPQVQVVEKIIFQKQPWYLEIVKVFLAIFIVSTIVWGISQADSIVTNTRIHTSVKNFSAIGVVFDITPTSISIDQANGSNDQGRTSYTFDIPSTVKIETKSYDPLTIQDIVVGSKVILQGVDRGGSISINRIVYISSTSSTTTPTTIEQAPTATTSSPQITSTTTEESTTTQTTDQNPSN